MILYHYTSNEAFLSIIESKQIWLSLLTLSNDKKERSYFYDQLKVGLFGEHVINIHTEIFDTIFDNFIYAKSAVGFCLSEDGDLLSQWRGYANNGTGVSIGFNKDAIEELLVVDDYEASMKLLKLKYIKFIDERFPKEDALKLYDKLIEYPGHHNSKNKCENKNLYEYSHRDYQEESKRINNGILELLEKTSDKAFEYKSPFFQEEKEWRLIKDIAEVPGSLDSQKCDFRVSDHKIVPYIKFPEREFPDDMITDVVLGPKNKTPIKTIEMLMKKNGLTRFGVKRSKGSYR